VVSILLVAVMVAGAVAINIGRPSLPLASKLMAKKARLGESLAGAAANEEYAKLQVAASEREGGSLADQFAVDLAAHVAVVAAEKSEAEAVAGMDVASTEGEGVTVSAEIVTANELDADVAQAAEDAAVTESDTQTETGLVIESLQSLEYQQSAETEAEADSDKPKSKKAKTNGKPKAAPKSKSKVAAKPVLISKRVQKTLVSAATKTSNCQFSSSPAAGVSKLTAVAFRAAPPLRDQAFAVEIDGSYAGPDVTYGSVTLQIARVRSSEPQAKDLPELVYRHSVVMSDVIAFSPFKSTDPLSATLYVPEAAFNMYAPAGDYVVTVVGTNQDKLPFFCAKVDFKLA